MGVRHWFVQRTFKFWERLGLHVTPVHFYQPIPDTRALPEQLWERRSELAGVDMREEEQLALLERLVAFREEYDAFRSAGEGPDAFRLANGFFESVDAEVLHALIRLEKPARIVEVGSGA